MDELSALFAYIDSDETRADVVELETLLTAHKALDPENGGDGEAAKCEALLEYLARKGLVGDGKPCKVERYDAADDRVSSGKRPNVVVTLAGSTDAASVWVVSHMDVVPAGEASTWDSDPWSVVEKDGVLYGRGVEDDQQGIVSSVVAMMAYIKCGKVPRRTVKLLFVADEEVGSKFGMRYLVEKYNLFNKDDIIIIPDGGDPKGETIEVAEKGILWLRITTTGLQSHGSRPDLGRNACLAASDLAVQLYAMEEVFDARDALFTPDYSTFAPTMREHNVDSVNIIPGADTFCMDCRVLPCYSLDDVMAEVQKRCSAIEEKYGVKVNTEVLQRASSPATSPDAPVVRALTTALKAAHGIEARTIGIGGGTVAAELRSKGYDAAVWSTIEDTAHQSNEHTIIANITADAKTLVAMWV